MLFGNDFAWGVATASYQIEGAWEEEGIGLNIWDVFSHEPDKVYENHNRDIACNHYAQVKRI